MVVVELCHWGQKSHNVEKLNTILKLLNLLNLSTNRFSVPLNEKMFSLFTYYVETVSYFIFGAKFVHV